MIDSVLEEAKPGRRRDSLLAGAHERLADLLVAGRGDDGVLGDGMDVPKVALEPVAGVDGASTGRAVHQVDRLGRLHDRVGDGEGREVTSEQRALARLAGVVPDRSRISQVQARADRTSASAWAICRWTIGRSRRRPLVRPNGFRFASSTRASTAARATPSAWAAWANRKKRLL
jgi:hypothetical protein